MMFENTSNSLYSSVLREIKKSGGKKRTLKGEINIKATTLQVTGKMLCPTFGLCCVQAEPKLGIVRCPRILCETVGQGLFKSTSES